MVDDRKTKLSLLAVVVGLGFFKVESIGDLAEGLQHTPVLALIVGCVFIFGLLALVIAIFLLALERDPTPISGWVFSGLMKVRAKSSKEEDAEESETENDDPRELFGAALVVLYGDPNEVSNMGPELDWLTQRIEEARLAYMRLADANRRVRKRLELGSLALLAAFASVIVVIGLVTYSASQVEPGPAGEAARGYSHVKKHENTTKEIQPDRSDQKDPGPAAGDS